jgi:cytochrome c553
MSDSTQRIFGMVSLVGVLCLGWVSEQSILLPAMNVWAGAPTSSNAKQQGNAKAGRSVFNGKGVCYYCHGVDGYRDKLPQLATDTAALIAQLNPQPADLRNRKSLRLTSDKARVKAIREGHPGTGMFPDTAMTKQELTDTLAYLTLLRHEGSATSK